MSFPKEDLGQILRDLRRRACLTQTVAAKRAGLDNSNLSKYESGEDAPKLDTLNRLLNVYGLDVVELLRVASGGVEGSELDSSGQDEEPEEPLSDQEEDEAIESVTAMLRRQVDDHEERLRELERLRGEQGREGAAARA